MNVINLSAIQFQILNLLVDISHQRGGTKTEISYENSRFKKLSSGLLTIQRSQDP